MKDNLPEKTTNDSDDVIAEAISESRAGDITRLRSWLQKGNNANKYDADGWTPLLWASARGHSDAVELLLNNKNHPADIKMAHRESEALPIHLAGHSGSVATAEILLNHQPDHLNAVWDLNGHTILLQTVFYGHLDLAEFVLKKGADTSITTARGLGPMELAAQFQNQTMMDLIKPYDSPMEAKIAYYETYLKRIAPVIPEDQVQAQKLSDQLVGLIEDGIKKSAQNPDMVQITLDEVKQLVEVGKADVNRLGGALQQPALVVTVTGNNGFPVNADVACLRNQLAEYLLKKGADPTLHEKHPMGAQTIIRASVFNHLEILQMCAQYITPERLADAINEIPVVNGLTAMHDTVLRATMAAPDRFQGYLDQARWLVNNGGRSDIEDFSGVTQRNIAENAKDPDVRKRLLDVLNG
jgi:hypothetical protein